MKKVKLSLKLNRKEITLEAFPMERLLDVLREQGSCTGVKEGCGEGECGACSIFLNGRIVNSCLIPALQVEGVEVTTIEGLSEERSLSKVQEAFLEKGGAQCGICTPGMVMAAVDLLRRKPKSSLEEIKEGLAGNLCRCTGYMRISDSVAAAAERGAD